MDRLGQPRQPFPDARQVALPDKGHAAGLDQCCRVFGVARGQRVMHRIGRQRARREAAGGGPVQVAQVFGMALLQERAQQVGEEVVIAIERALGIEWNQEQVRGLDLAQPLCRIRLTRERGCEPGIEPIQDRGAQQEIEHLGGRRLITSCSRKSAISPDAPENCRRNSARLPVPPRSAQGWPIAARRSSLRCGSAGQGSRNPPARGPGSR